MDLIPWDPWNELERIKAETDRLFDEFFTKFRRTEAESEGVAFLPDVDFIETPSEYRLYLSVPGLVEEDIDIDIGPKVLTVRGERQPPYDPDFARSRIREWRYGFFERRFQFPKSIHFNAVHASFDAGVLTIVVDKAAAG